MIKRTLTIAALLILAVTRAATEPQFGVVITITAGMAQRLIPGTTRTTKANSLLIEPLSTNTGHVFVLNCDPSALCVKGAAGTTWVADLAPGQSFSFPSNSEATNQSGGFDITRWQIDGATNGDTVLCSWDLRN